jgi:phage tail sheath gpL-like
LYQAFGVGRWQPTVRKPLVMFTGNTITAVASAVAVSDARPTDYTNSQLVAPGSRSLPFVVAARQLARIVVLANNNPPHVYGRQSADGILPGTDGEQWDYAQRDLAVKAGSSTIEVRDGIVDVSDVVTFYHPAGDPIPAYRFVVDIVKLQNILYNIGLIFNTAEWDGAPLLPDADPTTNAAAKKPKMARAAVGSMLDSLGLEAIISDPKTAKANTLAEIDSGNPKRLNVQIPVQLVGNTNIISVGLDFGFFFGSSAIVA